MRRLEGTSTARQQPELPPTTTHEVMLWQALDQLDDDDRELVRVWAWEQLEPREIAIVLDTTPSASSIASRGCGPGCDR